MQAYLDQAVQILREGFAQINDPKGLVIALAATIFLRSWKQWIPAALIATLIHIAIGHFAPVLAGQSRLALPPLMENQFWTTAGVLLVGYLIVIGIFYFIKRIVMTATGASGSPAAAKKH
jgi:hypothetical protein